MIIENKYLNKIKEFPEPIRQFGGLVSITVFVILSFAILNIYWGGGDAIALENFFEISCKNNRKN